MLAFRISPDEGLALRLEADRRGLSAADVPRQHIRSLETFVRGAGMGPGPGPGAA